MEKRSVKKEVDYGSWRVELRPQVWGYLCEATNEQPGRRPSQPSPPDLSVKLSPEGNMHDTSIERVDHIMSLQFTHCRDRSNGIAHILSMSGLFESAHRLEGIQVSLANFDIYMNGMLNEHIVST